MIIPVDISPFPCGTRRVRNKSVDVSVKFHIYPFLSEVLSVCPHSAFGLFLLFHKFFLELPSRRFSTFASDPLLWSTSSSYITIGWTNVWHRSTFVGLLTSLPFILCKFLTCRLPDLFFWLQVCRRSYLKQLHLHDLLYTNSYILIQFGAQDLHFAAALVLCTVLRSLFCWPPTQTCYHLSRFCPLSAVDHQCHLQSDRMSSAKRRFDMQNPDIIASISLSSSESAITTSNITLNSSASNFVFITQEPHSFP